MIFSKNKIRAFFSVSVVSVFILLGIFFRIYGLGYSNFQGDEIISLGFLQNANHQIPRFGSFVEFLFQQRKGPVQFVINYINLWVWGYHSELHIRIVFSIFSVLAIFATYFLVRKIFDKKVGTFSAILISISGLFISFGRISQYQSIIQFLLPLTLIFFLVGFEKEKKSWIFLSATFFSVSILAHYDSLSLISFFLIFFFHKFRKEEEIDFAKESLKLFSYLTVLLSGIFYVPYFFSSQFRGDTTGYLGNRLVGEGLFSNFGEILGLLNFYVPTFALVFLLSLSSFGLISFRREFKSHLSVWGKRLLSQDLFTVSGFILFFSVFLNSILPFRVFNFIGIFSCVIIYTTVLLESNLNIKKASLIGWFVATFSFYFLFVSDPRTHIYIAFIPVFLVSAVGFVELLDTKYFRSITLTVTCFVLIAQTAFNYQVFVDKSPEYPWNKKSVLGFDTKHRREDAKIHGIFGFNHYRHWEKIGEMFENGELEGKYLSNEKNGVTSFYLGYDESELEDANVVIWIFQPHSMETMNRNELEDFTKYTEFRNADQTVAEIWAKN